jgi:hypothetical protein
MAGASELGAALRRIRARLSARRKRTERRWLDALCEAAFVDRPDAGLLFFPWGALGPGYRVPAGAPEARLRRAMRWILGAGLLAVPAAALLAAASGRPAPALWVAGATGAALCLCLALLPRRLERSAERLRAAEARARVAAALGAGSTRALARGACLLAAACLGLYAARGGGELLAAAGGSALSAAAFAWGLRACLRRGPPR